MYDLLHVYYGTIVKVITGDTLVIDIDLGFRLTSRQQVRLAEVKAHEIRTEIPLVGGLGHGPGFSARAFLAQLCPVGSAVFLRTENIRDKSGRYAAWVFREEEDIREDPFFTPDIRFEMADDSIVNVNLTVANSTHARRIYTAEELE